MRKYILTGIVAIALVSVLIPAATSPAVAQSDNSTEEPSDTEIIDENTRLVSAEYDEEDGEAVVTIESATPQAITVTDAGAFIQGGEVRQRTVTVTPGRSTIRMAVTKVDGYTGVSIATRQTLYAVPIETSADVFAGSATWETVQAGAVGGAFGVIALAGVIAWRMRSGGRSKRRRIS